MIRTKDGVFITTEEFEKLKTSSNFYVLTNGSLFTALGSTEILFNNSQLEQKVIGVGILQSLDGSNFVYENLRADCGSIDVTRYALTDIGGGSVLIGNAVKNFPEHHSSGFPIWYHPFGFGSGTMTSGGMN